MLTITFAKTNLDLSFWNMLFVTYLSINSEQLATETTKLLISAIFSWVVKKLKHRKTKIVTKMNC